MPLIPHVTQCPTSYLVLDVLLVVDSLYFYHLVQKFAAKLVDAGTRADTPRAGRARAQV